jgi:hypothetical protein
MVRCCGKRQNASREQVSRSSGSARRTGPTTSGKQWRATLTSGSSVSKSYARSEQDVRAEVNRYLFYELDIQGEESKVGMVSESWPFKLREVTGIAADGAKVFQFRHGGDEFFVQGGSSFSLWIKDGMSKEELRLQMLGERWIAEQKPVDLDTRRPGDLAVPSMSERRKAIEQRAKEMLGEGRTVQVLEGLFFTAKQAYLALVEDQEYGAAYLVGSGLAPYRVKPSVVAPWRRLAIAIAEMLQRGKLTGPEWRIGKVW